MIGGSGPDVLAGGAGNDFLNGQGGIDDYFGEGGNDTIEARDGVAERISCGAGSDQARIDFIDIIAECEAGVDGDGDGFSSSIDCNDANPRINPGARERFENGIDEDCDGRDNVDLDRDGDGFARPIDCNDSKKRIRPNAREIRGNRVDENCDRRAEPFAQLATVVTNRWVVAGGTTAAAGADRPQRPQGRAGVAALRGSGLPDRQAATREGASQPGQGRAPSRLPGRAAGYRHPVVAEDQGEGDDRPQLYVHHPAQRAADKPDHLSRAGRQEGTGMLRRTLLAAAVAVLLAPAPALADGTFLIDDDRDLIVFTGDGGADNIAGFETATSIRFTRFGGTDLDGGNGCTSCPARTSTARSPRSGESSSTSAAATTSPPSPPR